MIVFIAIYNGSVQHSSSISGSSLSGGFEMRPDLVV